MRAPAVDRSAAVSGARAADSSSVVDVAVLAPGDLSHAAAGRHLVDGLRLGFAQAGDINVRVSEAELWRGHAGAVDVAQALLDAGAHVLVAGVAAPVADLLAPLCRDRGVPLVVAGAGAHVVNERVPGVLHCSQQHWQSALVMGDWAARRLGGSLFQVVAAQDAGYDAPVALRRGFQAAGGTLAGWAIAHDAPHRQDAAAAASAAHLSGATTVAVHATGRRAVTLVRALRAAGVSTELVVDGLGAEDFALSDLDKGSGNLYSASAWCAADAAGFARAFRAATGDAADPFSAVGYDAALLVVEGARRLAAGSLEWSRLTQVLEGAVIDGSRGRLTVGVGTGAAAGPLLVRRVHRGRNVVVARYPAVIGVPPELEVVLRTGTSAYVNEVLGT